MAKVCDTDMFERVCARCGKKFIIAPYHIYKLGRRVYCSYGCYRPAKEEAEAKADERKAKKKTKADRRGRRSLQ